MPYKRLKPEYHFTEDQLESLKRIVPEAFADGQINWETLKEVLGEYLEDDSPDSEHFGLFWPGKKQARRIAAIPGKGTLVPAYGEGLKADGTPDIDGTNDSHNIFIEGENLEVLKILQKSYAGRIKMIYIDPPYNTGNDFIYEDDFTEPLQEYLRRTGQVDEEGRPLTTNTRADGRFHSKWLSMMYPRLRLAHNILNDEGLIFVSIDDNEVHHLRSIMNEIFGDENFIAEFIWKSRQNKDNRNITGVSIDHEYIICFSKKNDDKRIRGSLRKISQYKNPDNDIRGPWTSGNMVGLLPEKLRPNCHYNLINPKTGINYGKPKMGWRYDINTMKKLIEEDRIIWPNSPEGRPRRKVFLNELDDQYTGYSSIIGNDIYTRDGSSEIDELFGIKAFDFPKPSTLIKELLIQGCDSDNIVLDFFAGSSVTAQAVLEKNKEDGNSRRFILIQMPEPCDEKSEAYGAGYSNIAEVGKERIRRVVKKLNDESNSAGNSEQQKLEFKEDSDTKNPDYGFKVFKLKESNYKTWKNYEGTDTKELEDLFANSQSPLVDNWRPENLLTEILLIEGFPLDSKLEQVSDIKRNKVTKVTSDFHEHSLLICLDSKIADDTIKQLNLSGENIFICLDNAVSDQDKVRLSDKGMIKTI